MPVVPTPPAALQPSLLVAWHGTCAQKTERHKQTMESRSVCLPECRESRECLPGSPNVCPAHANCLPLVMGRGRAGRAPVARRGTRA
eukprot:269906-Prymnesium_polylepis.1